MADIVEDDVIKSVLQDGISQVDENLIIEEFESAFEKETRKLRTYIKAVNKETDEQVEINQVFGR